MHETANCRIDHIPDTEPTPSVAHQLSRLADMLERGLTWDALDSCDIKITKNLGNTIRYTKCPAQTFECVSRLCSGAAEIPISDADTQWNIKQLGLYLAQDEKKNTQEFDALLSKGLLNVFDELNLAGSHYIPTALKCLRGVPRIDDEVSPQRVFEMLQELAVAGIGEAFAWMQDSEQKWFIDRYLLSGKCTGQEWYKRLQMLQQLMCAGLFELTRREGALGNDGPRFRKVCLESENPWVSFQTLQSVLTHEHDAGSWWTHFQYASMLFRETGTRVERVYAPFSVGSVPDRLPVAWRTYGCVDDMVTMKSFASMTIEERGMYLSDKALDEGCAERTIVSFDSLNRDTKISILAWQLFKAGMLSRDITSKSRATARNYYAAKEWGYPLQDGYLVHSTPKIENVRQMLVDGILCGEALDRNARSDSFPFGVDTRQIARGTKRDEDDFSQRLRDVGIDGRYGSFSLILYRDGLETGPDQATLAEAIPYQHRTIFGAVPATDISAIVVHGTDAAEKIGDTIEAIVDNGMYIPVYDINGELKLPFEVYSQQRRQRMGV